MRYFIFFGYDGTNYHGWQIQPNANSVQQELQRALSILLRKEIEVVGAGRTDTGVHARNMAAHFDWNPEQKVRKRKFRKRIPMALDQLVYRLNRILPRDIAVYEVREVDPGDACPLLCHLAYLSLLYPYPEGSLRAPLFAADELPAGFRKDEPGGAAFPASRRLCGLLQGRWRQQDHHLPRVGCPMGSDLPYHLVFRDYRQPLPPKHGKSRSGNAHRCRQGQDYDGAVSRYPAQRKPQ